MKSMTGYGCAQKSNDEMQMQIEIKSVNNRYLDIIHNIPYYLSSYEIAIDNKIKKFAKRGRVEVFIRVRLLKNDINVVVDEEVIKQYLIAFKKINEASQVHNIPQLSDFLSLEGALTSVKDNDTKKFEEPLFSLLDEALVQFIESKEIEGASTKKDLKDSIDKIVESLEVIKSRASEIEENVKTNIYNRMKEVLEENNFDENRVLQEIAIMLVKMSVNEEIKRLGTHLEALEKLLNLNESVGKRIDFLCQEINREINTIGSKSQIAELNLEVVRMKDNLENIREQARNVE